jgi:UDP-N-acetylmuramoyl-tripeptide--D-alanyl-D-alanine ligase
MLFSCGPDMSGLSGAVPSTMDALHTDSSDGLIGPLTETVRPGDVVTVKGSLGSRMAPVVEALLALSAANGNDNAPSRAAGGQG